MKLAIGADHGGYALKQEILDFLARCGHTTLDFGTNSTASVDYPDYALKVAQAVERGEAERGILVCGSGVGVSVAANKVPGIRAALCHDTFSARQGVEDDNLNVICFGARVIGPKLALDVLDAFLNARFSGLERHCRRLSKIEALEKRYMSDRGQEAQTI